MWTLLDLVLLLISLRFSPRPFRSFAGTFAALCWPSSVIALLQVVLKRNMSAIVLWGSPAAAAVCPASSWCCVVLHYALQLLIYVAGENTCTTLAVVFALAVSHIATGTLWILCYLRPGRIAAEDRAPALNPARPPVHVPNFPVPLAHNQ